MPNADAVYIDLWATRSVVGIQPKPSFYPLFRSLKQDENSKVIIFDPSQLEAKRQKLTAPDGENQSGEISVWWRRGRVELPVQRGAFSTKRSTKHQNVQPSSVSQRTNAAFELAFVV